MSINLYDDSIIESLRDLTQDTRIHIAPPENVFRTIGKLDDTEDHIQLPVVSVTRNSWQLLPAQHSQKYEGTTLNYDVSKDYVQNIQFIPIRINYTLDVWSKTRKENDILMRELIFYYTNHPTLKITVPYGAEYLHKFNVFFENNIEDNSDIVEHKNRGEYFRQSIGFYTDDAYLWKTSSRKFTKINLELFIVSPKNSKYQDKDGEILIKKLEEEDGDSNESDSTQ